MDRLSHFNDKIFDLIIIGGGVVGSGIARDAALRGLSVALFEKGDYCSGTTARSTRLIHGGLRYLETLDFKLVRLDLLERETLLRIANHLVRPMPFLVPLYNRSGPYRCKLRLGMVLYDLLSFDKTLPSHRRLSYTELAVLEPLLEKRGLQGGFLYHDAQVAAPERLVLENLIDAREHGAEACNYVEVIGAIYNENMVQGVRVRDLMEMTETVVRARLVVNASGPWVDQVSSRIGASFNHRVRMTKGIHFICPALSKQALVLFSNVDNRLFFVVPWLGQSLVGTTDTDYFNDPGDVQTQAADVDYLLESIRPFIPSIDRSMINYSYAGVRALVPEDGAPSSISRMHRIVDESQYGAPGLISIIGGKITGFRAIAEEVVDLVCARLGLRRACRTAEIPLPGCRPLKRPTALFPGTDTAQHLAALYGTRAPLVLDLAQMDSRLQQPLAPGHLDIGAQVVYSIRNEQCLRATDFLMRRSLTGFSPDQGRAALPAVIALMAEELNWSAARMDEEFKAHMQCVRKAYDGRDHQGLGE